MSQNIRVKTKVIATIGPACDSVATLKEMILAGMNVARLNMSHGTVELHEQTLLRVRQAADELDAAVAIMVDTRGREIRTGLLENGMIDLVRHQAFALYGDGRVGNEAGVSISVATLANHVKPGHKVLLDDGLLELVVTGTDDDVVHCTVECGGVLRERKGVNLPDTHSVLDDIPFDMSLELEFAAKHHVEYIAASFVRHGNEIHEMRRQLRKLGTKIPIIAKIESREGVDNFDSINNIAHGIMVARGDLGVELTLGEGPTLQKKIIRATVSQGKPVITATQMLDSMERNPRPTRAEVSDVANAIFDGSSAVMLSGETATGSRPVESVKTMVELAAKAEASLKDYGHLQKISFYASNEVTEAVAQAAITMADHLNAAVIIALTESGFTARLISKYRPSSPILAVTQSAQVVRRLAMNWGVHAVRYEGDGTDADRIRFATGYAQRMLGAGSSALAVLTAGNPSQSGSTDLIRVLRLDTEQL